MTSVRRRGMAVAVLVAVGAMPTAAAAAPGWTAYPGSEPGMVDDQAHLTGVEIDLDGFIATARGGRTTIAVPARVRALLAKPGRYELRADTRGRDEAASTRTAALTTP